MTIIVAPQRGQCQREELSEWTSLDLTSGGIEQPQASSCRHSARRESAKAISEKPEVTDADEAFGKHVQKEAA